MIQSGGPAQVLPLRASRLVMRLLVEGQPYLASLLRPATIPLYEEVESIVSALWDPADDRPNTPPGTAYREFLVGKLVEAGLLVARGHDEVADWYALQEGCVPALPQVDQVELTNACPFTCPFCPRGTSRMKRPIGHLDLGLLGDLVAQVKDQPQRKPFGLHHFGDPLLHPDTPGAIRIVAAAGLEPEISVNPILLTPPRAEALLEAGVGVLIVSMDGLDTPTLRAMRGHAAGEFEQVHKHVEALIALAAKRSRPPRVLVSMVGTTLNRHQWPELFERYTRPEHPWLTPVVRALDDFGDPRVAPLAVEPLRQPCAMPCQTVCVLWDGTVVACCHDFDGAISYGNLREQSLEEIWHGEKLRRFRERWKKLDFHPDEPCARCRWRIDRFVSEPTIANTDAWTRALWPERPFPMKAG
ncbi:MAG: radical SAM/SPASM domain-containing protein [Myxococcaceae bacterium]